MSKIQLLTNTGAHTPTLLASIYVVANIHTCEPRGLVNENTQFLVENLNSRI